MPTDISTTEAEVIQRTEQTRAAQDTIQQDNGWVWPLKTLAQWDADLVSLDASAAGSTAKVAQDRQVTMLAARGLLDARFGELHQAQVMVVGVMRVRAATLPGLRNAVTALSAAGNTRVSIEEEADELLTVWEEWEEQTGAAFEPAPGKTLAAFRALLDGGANPATQPKLDTLKKTYSTALSKWRSAVGLYDALLSRLEDECVGWYAEATKVFPEGTPLGDMIREQITTSYSPPPPAGTPPIPLPTAPQNGSVGSGNPGSGEVNFDWQPAPAGQAVTDYHIYRDGVLLATVQAPPATLGGFTSGEAVTLTVRAVNATGEGPGSEPVTGTAG